MCLSMSMALAGQEDGLIDAVTGEKDGRGSQTGEEALEAIPS
jgi:hypothetical protein